jgi:adenosylhomocysteinase
VVANEASVGARKIEWVRDRMGILRAAARSIKKQGSLQGRRVGMALHVEAKTAALAIALHEAGAKVTLSSCNPLSTDDAVAEALRDEFGIPTYARRGETGKEYYANLTKVADSLPEVAIDDGGDLTGLLHESPKRLKSLRGVCEETTTGVVRMHAMHKAGRLKTPVIDINGADMKHLFDNRYGTGQSVIDGLLRATNLSIAGKTFLVAGYGWCGRGIAMRARGMGAEVLVTEVDPVRAIEARFDGFRVLPIRQGLPDADFVVTATGNTDVVGPDEVPHLKDGVILANAGHFDVEISKPGLKKHATSVKQKRLNLTEYRFKDGRRALLVAEGRLVNLAAGEGHPVEVMDASFSLQALCAAYIADEGPGLGVGVHPVPRAIDQTVAKLALQSFGIGIDRLSSRQTKYLHSFEEGT